MNLNWMALVWRIRSEASKAARQMERHPLDRRCFRDACAAARWHTRFPEHLPQDMHFAELIVARLAFSQMAFVQDLQYLLSLAHCLSGIPLREFSYFEEVVSGLDQDPCLFPEARHF